MELFLQTLCVPLDKEAWIFVGGSAILTFIASLIHPNLGWVFAILTVWVAYFFRDPARVVPQDANLIISSADGRVSQIIKATPPEELDLPEDNWTKISVFLNVFNVHVNRIPVAGKIIKSHYRPGKFLNASLDKASIHNERQSLAIETNEGTKIAFVQIAGLVARRIRCDVSVGQEMCAGERFGMIRFGSRVDIYLPSGVNPKVCVGQLVIGGETVMAELNSSHPAIEGKVL